MGFRDSSFRLCFGEVDGVPGLIVDRYVVGEDPIQQSQVFVIQCHSAGADRLTQWVQDWESFFEKLLKTWADSDLIRVSWRNTGLVIKNDVSVRTLEGLKVEDPKVLRTLSSRDGGGGMNLEEISVRIRSAMGELPIPYWTDLVHGQKTGFFLDQYQNIRMGLEGLSGVRPASPGEPIRILDLFSYVGQWSVQMGRYLRAMGSSYELTLVDASKKALAFAERNVKALGAPFECRPLDILKELRTFRSESFDLIICDPPALIKSKKDLMAGQAAYRKLSAEVFRILRPGGISVHCSCSYHLGEDAFQSILSSTARESKKEMTWIARGGFSPDHPVKMEFAEGHYLKGWLGVCRK